MTLESYSHSKLQKLTLWMIRDLTLLVFGLKASLILKCIIPNVTKI